MSVENRIFWLVVGILALYLVLTAGGRSAVQRFIQAVTGNTSGGSESTTPIPDPGPDHMGDGPNPEDLENLPANT